MCVCVYEELWTKYKWSLFMQYFTKAYSSVKRIDVDMLMLNEARKEIWSNNKCIVRNMINQIAVSIWRRHRFIRINKSYYNGKTVSRPCYLYKWNLIPGKADFILTRGPRVCRNTIQYNMIWHKRDQTEIRFRTHNGWPVSRATGELFPR